MDVTRREALQSVAAVATAAGLPLAARAAASENAAKKLKIVIAGAHPDDPESACGGLIALCTDAGHEVVNLYLTRGEAGIAGKTHQEAAAIRTQEAESACKELGARPLYLTQIDGSTEVNKQRYDEMKEALMSEAPDIVVTHWPIDTHRDHRVISTLVYDVWHNSDRAFDLYYFEVETGDQTQVFWPTHYVDITSVESRKRKACYHHKSQGAKGGFYVVHDAMNRFRGREAGFDFAEAYVRHTRNLRNTTLPSASKA